MDKARRNELGKLKFKKRLKQLGLKEDDREGRKVNYNCYRTTGQPCSCILCSPEKYKRSEKHKKNFDEE